MRKVTRATIPASLQKHAKKWTKDLLDAIKKSKKEGSKVPEKYYTKYKQKDVLDALKTMYGDEGFTYCCYCESIINSVSHEQIEHRMPKKKTKDKYPGKTFDWDNLHLACEKCNNKKRSQYDEKDPILDSVNDDIEIHLGYRLDSIGAVYREVLSSRGKTTVEHTDLDRDPLLKARLKVWLETLEAIKEITLCNNNARNYTPKKILIEACNGPYGSLVKHLMSQWRIA